MQPQRWSIPDVLARPGRLVVRPWVITRLAVTDHPASVTQAMDNWTAMSNRGLAAVRTTLGPAKRPLLPLSSRSDVAGIRDCVSHSSVQ